MGCLEAMQKVTIFLNIWKHHFKYKQCRIFIVINYADVLANKRKCFAFSEKVQIIQVMLEKKYANRENACLVFSQGDYIINDLQ